MGDSRMSGDFRLKVFIEVFRTGSFTKAAGNLGISQPAVSQNIAGLEKELGTRLFDRIRGDVLPTASGRIFMTYAEKILYWYDSARSVFRNDGSGCTWPLEIICSADMSSSVVPAVSSAAEAVFPDFSFHVRQMPAKDILDKVSAADTGDCVCVFSMPVSCPPGTFPGLRQAGMSDVCAVVSPSSAYALSGLSGTGISLAVWDDGVSSFHDIFPAEYRHCVRLYSSSPETVRSVVSISPGFAGILPYHSVVQELASGALVRVPFPGVGLEYGVWFFSSGPSPVSDFVFSRVSDMLQQ